MTFHTHNFLISLTREIAKSFEDRLCNGQVEHNNSGLALVSSFYNIIS